FARKLVPQRREHGIELQRRAAEIKSVQVGGLAQGGFAQGGECPPCSADRWSAARDQRTWFVPFRSFVKQKIAGIVRDRTFSEIPSVARDRYSWNRRQGLYVWSN